MDNALDYFSTMVQMQIGCLIKTSDYVTYLIFCWLQDNRRYIIGFHCVSADKYGYIVKARILHFSIKKLYNRGALSNQLFMYSASNKCNQR